MIIVKGSHWVTSAPNLFTEVVITRTMSYTPEPAATYNPYHFKVQYRALGRRGVLSWDARQFLRHYRPKEP
jgi:hypothetical protein